MQVSIGRAQTSILPACGSCCGSADWVFLHALGKTENQQLLIIFAAQHHPLETSLGLASLGDGPICRCWLAQGLVQLATWRPDLFILDRGKRLHTAEPASAACQNGVAPCCEHMRSFGKRRNAMICRVKKTRTEPAQNRSMHAHEHMNREPMDTHNHLLQHLPREIFAAALRCGRPAAAARVCPDACLHCCRRCASHLKPPTANDHAHTHTPPCNRP